MFVLGCVLKCGRKSENLLEVWSLWLETSEWDCVYDWMCVFFFSLNSVHRLVQCRAIPIRYELFFFHHFYFDWTNIIIYSIWMDSELRWARDTRCLYVVVASENMCQFMLESVDWNQLIIYCCCCCWNVVKVAMK